MLAMAGPYTFCSGDVTGTVTDLVGLMTVCSGRKPAAIGAALLGYRVATMRSRRTAFMNDSVATGGFVPSVSTERAKILRP